MTFKRPRLEPVGRYFSVATALLQSLIETFTCHASLAQPFDSIDK
jgi:hypothetical protein